VIVLGVGFSNRCSADELAGLATDVRERALADREGGQGNRIATLERKRESGLLEPVAERLGLTPCYLTESELAAVEAVGSSPRTAATVGVGSVAEAAALAAAGPGARLVVEKVTSPLATCAAAVGQGETGS
jgi:cobalt-precorrin 5A hydrolase